MFCPYILKKGRIFFVNMELSALVILISKILFKPRVFVIFLGGLIVLSLCAIFNYFIALKREEKLIKNDTANLRSRWEKQLAEYQKRNSELSLALATLRVQIDAQLKEIETITLGSQERLGKKEEALQNEIISRERLKAELENTQSQMVEIKNKLELKERELSQVNKLKDELKQKEEELKNKILDKEKISAQLKDAQEQLLKSQNNLKPLEDNNAVLKEQLLAFERKVDALTQALALEKTLKPS